MCIGQTTYFNSSPIIDDKESTRLYSLEIAEDHVIVTIEITTLKKKKRINYWTTPNTYIFTGNTPLAIVKGYYINGRIEQCGYNHQWGWSNVEQGAKNYYRLYFEGTIPSGITTISIVDKGTQEWNGYNYNTVHSYCFNNISIIYRFINLLQTPLFETLYIHNCMLFNVHFIFSIFFYFVKIQ